MLLPRQELCEAKSWTRPTLSDAWDATNWDGRLAVTLEVFQVLKRWHRMEERTNHTTTNVENEPERLFTAP